MRSIHKVWAICAAGLLLSQGAQAAKVELQWQDPAQFRDIRSTDIGQKAFQARVMEELEEQFRREADQLADDQTLFIAVEDVDLAGEIEYFHRGYPFGLRVIRRLDSPSLKLRYELRAADDTVLAAGAGRVRDPGFRSTTLMPVDRSMLKYEKALISDWYDEAFADTRN